MHYVRTANGPAANGPLVGELTMWDDDDDRAGEQADHDAECARQEEEELAAAAAAAGYDDVDAYVADTLRWANADAYERAQERAACFGGIR